MFCMFACFKISPGKLFVDSIKWKLNFLLELFIFCVGWLIYWRPVFMDLPENIFVFWVPCGKIFEMWDLFYLCFYSIFFFYPVNYRISMKQRVSKMTNIVFLFKFKFSYVLSFKPLGKNSSNIVWLIIRYQVSGLKLKIYFISNKNISNW